MVGKLLTKTSSFVKSKVTVFIAMAVMLLGVVAVSTTTTSQADDASSSYGTIYQKYLLMGSDTEQANDKKILGVGSLGSGGVSGQFSYGDIVSSMNSQDGTTKAKIFSTAMATYSKYNYLTYKPQAFSSIISMVGRVLLGLVLLIFGLFSDSLNLLFHALAGLISAFNVIPMLASAIANTNYVGDLQSALGLSASVIKQFISVMMSFLLTSVLIALYMGLYRGSSKADKGALSKAKGRLFSLVALPIAVIVASGLMQQVSSLAFNNGFKGNASFANYMVDDKNWAFKYNLSPQGSDTSGTVAKTMSAKDGYIDTDYNPYAGGSDDLIRNLNAGSKIADIQTDANGNSKLSNFSNTSLALEYMTLDTFDAKAYIGYLTSAQSQKDGAKGSIYARVNSGNESEVREKLADVGTNYASSSLNKMTDQTNQKPSDSSYGKAIDDYASDNKSIVSSVLHPDKKSLLKNVSTSTAWVDRFIYGYKSTGAKMKDYYNAPISLEQITMNTGNADGYGLSDESTYFALSTQFTPTGGKYLLDAPARGILASKATFDSNRADYYTVSIVGVPLFTAFKMLSGIVMQIVVLTAVVMGILSLGLLDMNLRPIMAWFKGVTKGDIEYAGAFLIYAGGIAGTLLTINFIPAAIMSVLDAISHLVLNGLSALTATGGNSGNADAGLAQGSLSALAGFIFSVAILLMFFKVKDFREKLIIMITFPWAWAKEAGTRMERKADGNNGKEALKNATAMASNSKVAQTLNAWNDTADGKTTAKLGAFTNDYLENGSVSSALDKAKLAGRVHDRDQKERIIPELGKVFGFDAKMPDKEEFTEPFVNDELRDSVAGWSEPEQALEAFEANPTQSNADALKKSVDAHNKEAKSYNRLHKDPLDKIATIDLPEGVAEQLHDGTAVERMTSAVDPVKVDETVETEPVLEPGQTKQVDNATFNARQALSDLKAKHPEMDDALIDDTENALHEFELEPSEQNLDTVIQQLNKVHENVEMDGDTENDFKVMQDGLVDTRDIAQDFDTKTQDALAKTDKPADVTLDDKQVETTTQSTAKVTGKQTIDLATDQSGVQTETKVTDDGVPSAQPDVTIVPDTNESNATKTIDLGDTTSTGTAKAVGKQIIDLTPDQSGVQTETKVTDDGVPLAQPDVKIAPNQEPIPDQTVDMGTTTSTGTTKVTGKQIIDLTPDQSGVQTETKVTPAGTKPATPDVKIAPSQEPIPDQTVDMGTTTSTGKAKVAGKRVIDVTTTDATTQDIKTSGLTGTNAQEISKQVAQDFEASQSGQTDQDVDVTGQARGKATLQGSRRRVIDVTDATTTSGDTTINRVNKADLKQTLDEAEFAKTDVPTDVDVNADETKPRFGSRLFGRNKK